MDPDALNERMRATIGGRRGCRADAGMHERNGLGQHQMAAFSRFGALASGRASFARAWALMSPNRCAKAN
jgi:hypothetical protein